MASGKLILPLAEPALGDTGLPISGATLTVYISGGLTPASLFADAGLVTPIENPQTSNAAGRMFAQSTEIWADASQAYDCVLAYPSTGQSFTFDNVYLLGAGANTSGFAPINSPNFTGVPTAPTPALNDISQKIATTAFVKGQNYAPLNSPALTGVPTAPTAAGGTNTTQIATTAFVAAATALGAQSLGTSGYVTLPGGLIIQWGQTAAFAPNVGTQTIALPHTFPTAAYTAYVSTIQSTNDGVFSTVVSVSTTQILIRNVAIFSSDTSLARAVNWMAIGS